MIQLRPVTSWTAALRKSQNNRENKRLIKMAWCLTKKFRNERDDRPTLPVPGLELVESPAQYTGFLRIGPSVHAHRRLQGLDAQSTAFQMRPHPLAKKPCKKGAQFGLGNEVIPPVAGDIGKLDRAYTAQE